MNIRTERVGIVGAGRLGGALARALVGLGMPVSGVASASAVRAAALANEVGARAVPLEALSSEARLIFVTVSDASIADVATALAPTLSASHALVHTSGARDLSVLDAAARAGARVGCFHPLQSFPEGACAERFASVSIGIEAEPPLRSALEEPTRALGATPLSLEGVDRARYHAAAVFASNYVVALHALAAEAFCAAGLPKDAARAALSPLSRGAVESIGARPLHEALTGPLSRGDVATVKAQLEALAAMPELVAAYRVLGRALLALRLSLDASAHAELSLLLSSPDR